MEEIRLDVEIRQELGSRKVKKIKNEGHIPAVIYGRDMKPLSIKVDRRIFGKILRSHEGENIIFHLTVKDGDKKLGDFPALVKEEQVDPVKEDMRHVDFQRISLTQEIEVKVPIIAKGEAVGVKQDGGALEHPMWELEVICLPTQIPAKIEVDVSFLKIGDAIHVRDIALPLGVRSKVSPDAIVITVAAPMKEEVAAPVEGAPTEPEVLREKKKEETPEAAKAEDKAEAKKSDSKSPDKEKK